MQYSIILCQQDILKPEVDFQRLIVFAHNSLLNDSKDGNFNELLRIMVTITPMRVILL